MKEIRLPDSHENMLNVYIFDDVKEPKGVVQVVHGINEHGERYVEFCEFLNKNGYIAIIHDHLSQGKSRTPKDGEVVYFGKHGTKKLLDGVRTIKKYINKHYFEYPQYAVGHSMGALLLRKSLLTYTNDYDGIVLNGTGLSMTKGLGVAILIGKFLKLFGAMKPSKYFDNMFRKTQLKLKEKVEMNHFIEWLTRDEEKTKINLKDEYLFVSLSISAFVDLLSLISEVNNPHSLLQNEAKAKILLMSGTHDPSTNFGKDTTFLYELLKKLGNDVEIKLYEEGRHDTLQEINREDVFKDIIEFFEK